MPTVKNVGEPCAGEPHARFDGGREETRPVGYAARPRRLPSTRPLPTRYSIGDLCSDGAVEENVIGEDQGSGGRMSGGG